MNMFASRFEEKMRIFVKETKNSRAFELQRYCYRSSIDDWITIDWDEKLENIVKKLIHLGKESYYELM